MAALRKRGGRLLAPGKEQQPLERSFCLEQCPVEDPAGVKLHVFSLESAKYTTFLTINHASLDGGSGECTGERDKHPLHSSLFAGTVASPGGLV